MVPEEYRLINRAVCLLEDEHVEDREAARSALHALFRSEARLRSALKFYASPANHDWRARRNADGESVVTVQSVVDDDAGQRARQALG